MQKLKSPIKTIDNQNEFCSDKERKIEKISLQNVNNPSGVFINKGKVKN